MNLKATNDVGSARLWRVQFGVSPNCNGQRTIEMTWINNGKLWPHTVLGVTPETTRGTRVLPTAFRVYAVISSTLPLC